MCMTDQNLSNQSNWTKRWSHWGHLAFRNLNPSDLVLRRVARQTVSVFSTCLFVQKDTETKEKGTISCDYDSRRRHLPNVLTRRVLNAHHTWSYRPHRFFFFFSQGHHTLSQQSLSRAPRGRSPPWPMISNRSKWAVQLNHCDRRWDFRAHNLNMAVETEILNAESWIWRVVNLALARCDWTEANTEKLASTWTNQDSNRQGKLHLTQAKSQRGFYLVKKKNCNESRATVVIDLPGDLAQPISPSALLHIVCAVHSHKSKVQLGIIVWTPPCCRHPARSRDPSAGLLLLLNWFSWCQQMTVIMKPRHSSCSALLAWTKE